MKRSTAPFRADAAPLTAAAGLLVRLGVRARELACLAAIVLGAAALRLVNLPARGSWDSDQGTEMLALRTALSTGRLPTFGPQAISVGGTFHHGALYYDLLLPAAWLGNGDPTFVVAEIALLGLLVVPMVWWIARSIGGPAAGLSAALLAAVSASLIGYSTFLWNPTLVEPGAALAYLGAWQAWRSNSGRWWLLAAFGAAVAMQSHVAGAVIVLPLAVVYVAALVRARGRRRATLAWGLAGVALVAMTYLPLIAYELSHDFAETRGMLGYFSGPDTASTMDPLARVLFAGMRILAWPLTRWPMVDLRPGFLPALVVAVSLASGLLWRVAKAGTAADPGRAAAESSADAAAPANAVPADAAPADAAPADAAPADAAPGATERAGTRFIAGSLLLAIVALGLGLRAVSEVQDLPTEQYHVVADPLVLVAAGLIAGGLWQSLPRRRPTLVRRIAAVAAIVALVAWNAGHWPPLTAPDGGWPAAQSAATRVERDAAGTEIALVPLFAPKGSDAYAYPLNLDGVRLAAPADAQTVVVLCDSYWLTGCGGSQEDSWVAADPAGTGLKLIDRFAAAPDRTLSVYRRVP